MYRRERYDRYIKPYAKPLLALEFLFLPAFNLIVYAFGGSLLLAIVTSLTWVIGDALFTVFTGCSLLGIYLRGSPVEMSELPPHLARGGWQYRLSSFMVAFFILFLALSDFMIVYILPARTKWQDLIYVFFFFQAIFMHTYIRLNLLGGKPDPQLRYEKHQLVLCGFLLVSLLAIVALLVHDDTIRNFILIIDLVPAAFVVYYANKLIGKTPWGQAT